MFVPPYILVQYTNSDFLRINSKELLSTRDQDHDCNPFHFRCHLAIAQKSGACFSVKSTKKKSQTAKMFFIYLP